MRIFPLYLLLQLPILADNGIVPTAKDIDEWRTIQNAAVGKGRVFFSDLMAANGGQLFFGKSELLQPGRYRLHLSLAISPLADPHISDIEITVTAWNQHRVLSTFDFPRSDEPVDTSLAFSIGRELRVPVRIGWKIGKNAEMARIKLRTPKDGQLETVGPKLNPEEDEEGLEEEDDELEFERAKDGSLAIEQVMKMKYRLYVQELVIERLPPLEIVYLRSGKVSYKPGEEGVLVCRIRNSGTGRAEGVLAAELEQELADTNNLPEQKVEIEAGGEKTIRIPFRADGRWGTCATVTLTCQGRREIARDYFSVSNNIWEVGIGSVWGSSAHTGLGNQREIPPLVRDIYANWVELFFWAPDDFAMLVSPIKKWWSGQTAYPEDEDNLDDLIRLCHQQGIKVVFYAKGAGGGPFGWEVARRRPDLFSKNRNGTISGHYSVQHLDHWNDPEWRKENQVSSWYIVHPNLTIPETLDYAIDQVVQSIRRYKWDGVRYDGHYTIGGRDELSAHNMRLLKERVWKEFPDFRFGFNYGYCPDAHGGMIHEIREAMAGGGLYMQEAIRNWRYTKQQYKSWRYYAVNELRAAKQVNSAGGTYHGILSLESLKTGQAVYKLILTLIAGGHPCYGSYKVVPGCWNWGALMTRWSSMIWDVHLKPLKKPEERISVESEKLFWKSLAQERIQSERRKFVVQHLVNPPLVDSIPDTDLLPPPHGSVKVHYRAEPGTKVIRALLVQPDTRPFGNALETTKEEAGLTVTVPWIHQWAMVIWEIEGRFELPEEHPRFTELPDEAKIAEARKGRSSITTDPLKPATEPESDTNEIIVLCNHGSQNVGANLILDEESDVKQVEWRPKTEGSGRFGMSWIGPLKPGRHRMSFRFKWVDPAEKPVPQWIDMQVLDHNWEDVLATFRIVTPGHTNEKKVEHVFRSRGKYEYYLVGTYTKKFEGFIHVMGTGSTTKLGEHTVYMDKIRIEELERFPDSKVDEYVGEHVDIQKKPDDLRKPNGAKPKRIFFVKGMFWQPYLGANELKFETGYALPKTYEDLYLYDALVICNLDFHYINIIKRKMLKTFVEDGGRIVFLGGSFTLGQGNFLNTFLDDILPVDCKGNNEVIRCQPPLLLGSEQGKPWPKEAAVFYRHLVTQRKRSRVLAYAGDQPIAFEGEFGKGTVAVFAGASMGEGGRKETPFWNTARWKGLMKRMVMED